MGVKPAQLRKKEKKRKKERKKEKEKNLSAPFKKIAASLNK